MRITARREIAVLNARSLDTTKQRITEQIVVLEVQRKQNRLSNLVVISRRIVPG